jgi:hypothetical protein
MQSQNVVRVSFIAFLFNVNDIKRKEHTCGVMYAPGSNDENPTVVSCSNGTRDSMSVVVRGQRTVFSSNLRPNPYNPNTFQPVLQIFSGHFVNLDRFS